MIFEFLNQDSFFIRYFPPSRMIDKTTFQIPRVILAYNYRVPYQYHSLKIILILFVLLLYRQFGNENRI